MLQYNVVKDVLYLNNGSVQSRMTLEKNKVVRQCLKIYQDVGRNQSLVMDNSKMTQICGLLDMF